MKSAWKMLTGFALLFIVVALLIPGSPTSTARNQVGVAPRGDAPETNDPVVSEPVVPGLSQPVRDLPLAESDPSLDREVSPRFTLDALPGAGDVDPNWQDPIAQTSTTGFTPTPILSFDGLDRSQGNATPPDTVGVVGMNHFIQMVNATVFAVWDKDGNLVQPATQLRTLWSSGGCSNSTSGDPVISYDWDADRWVLAQFANGFTNGICVAVSETSDPLGAYHTYQFNFGSFPDYFKIGVWSDAYYVGANQSGQNVHALERAEMLDGNPAGMVSFSIPNVGNHSMPMPADIDGHTLPPAGEPGIYYRHIDSGANDRLEMFEFNVNWANPGSSSLTGPVNIPVTNFGSLCGFSFSCINQPGTSQRVDSITEWPMFRFAYRNFGTHEALVANNAVNVGGNQAGIRWYELRRVGGGAWTIHQESTFAPDSDSRWMASMAMDGDGNMAIGYNVSSNSTFPSIRYATRLATDPLNTLQTEQSLIAGSGSQTSSNRWGDYSTLSVDPADDCTFWFTGEYYQSSGSNWRTRIGSFKIDECGGGGGDPDVVATTTPLNGTTPDPGDTIEWNSAITNNGGSSTTATINILLTRPGKPDIVLAGPKDINLNAGETKSRDFTFTVPASAGAGTFDIVTEVTEGGTTDTDAVTYTITP